MSVVDWVTSLRIGIHTSRSGSLEKAASRAAELGANTLQIFSASPRMWRATFPQTEEVRRFQDARQRLDLYPLVIHTNYLMNLASLDPVLRPRSIESFRAELQRAAMIGAQYLVTHPGHSNTCTAEQGMEAFVLGLRDAAAGLDLDGLTVLIENTVGAGAQLGSKLEELRNIHDLALQSTPVRVGYCLDTCHLLAAGFPVHQPERLADFVATVDRVLGVGEVKLFHANDSKGGLNSHLDRHANIGKGQIGKAAFRAILRHPSLRPKPFILETPVDVEGDDRRNLDLLKELAGPEPEIRDQANTNREKGRKRSGNAGKGVRLPGNRK